MSEMKSEIFEERLKHVKESLPIREPLKLVIQLLLLRISPERDPEMWEIAWAAYHRLDDFSPTKPSAPCAECERLREVMLDVSQEMNYVACSREGDAQRQGKLRDRLLTERYAATPPQSDERERKVSVPTDDEMLLRLMLAEAYCGAMLYCHDGELQDARTTPIIDFKRDSPAIIQSKMQQREVNALKEAGHHD